MGTKGISRRGFPTGAGSAALAAAGMSLVGCAPKAESSTGNEQGAQGATQSTRRTPPEPITDAKGTFSADVIVVSAGISGCVAAMSAAVDQGPHCINIHYDIILEAGVQLGTVCRADTIEELAAQFDMPEGALSATIKRYNELVASK